MKKFLSLVLALVMAMSLVTVSAGAKDFTDDSTITYKEAVDVMSAVEVINGYAGGDFQPAGVLTRGAAAKIICNLILGPTNAAALVADAGTFKDVPANHVFAGYIAYCAQQGIINGYGDGTFRPAGTLNGYAFMKMLLGALGYDGKVEGFTGPNWTINVAKLAKFNGLDAGLKADFVGTKAVTREEACLYALNTVKATMVEYDGNLDISAGDVHISNKVKATPVDQWGYKDIYDGEESEMTLQFGEKYFPRLTLKSEADALGRKSNVWTYKNAKIGTYNSDDAILTYTVDMSSTSSKAEVKKALKNYDMSKTQVYFNGAEGPVGITSADVAEYTGNGILVEVYADGDDITDVVVVDSYIGQVTKVNNSDETITVELKGMDRKIVTAAGYGEFAKDAYVMVSPIYDRNDVIARDQDDAVLVAAEMVAGKVNFANASKVVIDGTTYKAAEINAYAAPSAKDDVEIYLDAYGFVVYSSKVSAKDLVYAVATYQVEDKYGDASTYVQAVKIDGSIVELELANTSAAPVQGKLYSYNVSGNKINLKAAPVATNDKAAYVTYVEDMAVKSSTKDLNKRYFADETVFISVKGMKGDLKVSVASGKQLVKSDLADYAIIAADETEANKATDIAVVFVNATSVTNVKDLILVADADKTGYTDLNGNDYDNFDVYVNGESQNIAVDTDESDALVKGALYTYGKNGDDAYVLTRIDATEDVRENAKVTDLYKNNLYLGKQVLTIVDDTKFIDMTDNGVDSADALDDLYSVAGTDVYVTVVYNDDDEVEYLYVVDAEVMFVAVDGGYVLNADFDAESLASISYKLGNTTNVVRNEIIPVGAKSISVATDTGLTFDGVLPEA